MVAEAGEAEAAAEAGHGGRFDRWTLVVVCGAVAWTTITGWIVTWWYRRRRARRVAQVHSAAAVAVADDRLFSVEAVTMAARRLFVDVQEAWDAHDEERLAELLAPDLLNEWRERLAEYDANGWRNRVIVHGVYEVEYVGLVNRVGEFHDRVTVRISATVDDWWVDRHGTEFQLHEGRRSRRLDAKQWWTLSKQPGGNGWRLDFVAEGEEGDYALAEEIVAAPARPRRRRRRRRPYW